MNFSIVTAVHNGGEFIRDCIESVLMQTGVQVEHIIIDACSTDATLEIVKSFPHLVWTSEPDNGISHGINKGFRRATGEWVMWLNADDYLLPDALRKVAEFCAEHPTSDVVYGGWHYVDETKRVLKTSKVFPFDRQMLVHYGTYIGSTACWFRRSTIQDADHFLNEEFRYNMDGEYFARLAANGKEFAYLPEVLACFRLHGANASFKEGADRSVTGLLRRQKQWAESGAIRRAYGITLFDHPIADSVTDAILWSYYRLKKIALKFRHQSYS